MGKRRKTPAARERLKLGNFHVPSPEEIAASESGNGGWTAMQLAEWGVAWPPKQGWRKELERKYRERKENGNARSNL